MQLPTLEQLHCDYWSQQSPHTRQQCIAATKIGDQILPPFTYWEFLLPGFPSIKTRAHANPTKLPPSSILGSAAIFSSSVLLPQISQAANFDRGSPNSLSLPSGEPREREPSSTAALFIPTELPLPRIC